MDWFFKRKVYKLFEIFLSQQGNLPSLVSDPIISLFSSFQNREYRGVKPFLTSFGFNSPFIQLVGYLPITHTLFFMEIFY